ncbi:hypothetical protein J132_09512 [Termitomyces sp. J132]|nr:hypothetical protein H2248_006146 [Termitomyces sp. 'cryptogamus']KNZ73871.1 hypothetical protein J132_09512 [Termitomyces sp. J132]
MAVSKFLNLFALSSIAILAFSYGAAPVAALSLDPHHLAARSPASHAVLARKKRFTNSKRCKPRPPPSAASSVAKPTTTTAVTTKAVTTNAVTTKASSSPAPAATSKAASSSPSASNTSTNSGSSGGGKVGIAWPQDDDTALTYFKTAQSTRLYTWSPWIPPKAKELGFQGVPMLWGEKQISDFARIVVDGYAHAALGFNEPNQQGQSDMTPQRAAQVWQQYIQPLKAKGYSLISPAPTNAPSGKTWLQEFFSACGGCTFDGLAVHFYGTDPQAFIDYLTEMHNAFGLPIWVTEYACQNFGGGAQCDEGQVWNWMKTTKTFMDNTSWVTAYFAFGAMYDMGNVNPLNQLLGSNGQPTSLGWYYIN